MSFFGNLTPTFFQIFYWDFIRLFKTTLKYTILDSYVLQCYHIKQLRCFFSINGEEFIAKNILCRYCMHIRSYIEFFRLRFLALLHFMEKKNRKEYFGKWKKVMQCTFFSKKTQIAASWCKTEFCQLFSKTILPFLKMDIYKCPFSETWPRLFFGFFIGILLDCSNWHWIVHF